MKPEVPWPALVVVTHESAADMRRSLPGLVATAERLDTSLIVVDNASTDGTRRLLGEWSDRSRSVITIELSENVGYAGAANRAIGEAGERDVMLLNPDVELPGPAPVEALALALRERERAAVVAPRLVGSDGEPQPSARRLASLPAMLGSLPPARFVPPLRHAYEHYLAPSYAHSASTVGWVIGAAMLLRRRAVEQVGGFDDGFFLYMEDADLCRRLHRAGWSIDYLPEVTLRHGYNRASSVAGANLLNSQARRRHVMSLARYWRKHPRALIGGER